MATNKDKYTHHNYLDLLTDDKIITNLLQTHINHKH